MSQINVNIVKGRTGGAPDFPSGATVTGIVTATSFSGNATTATTASGLTGTPTISVTDVTASGSVSVGGTLTYEDVANIDSVGLITARSGIIVTSGISTFKGAHFDGGTLLKEKVNITAGKLSANLTINTDNGMVHYFTTQEDAQSIPNIISGAGINTDMAIGDTMTISVLTTAHANSFPTNWRIDGVEASAGVTTYWNGGSAPSAGNGSGVDFYTLNFVKTAGARYTAFANVSNFA